MNYKNAWNCRKCPESNTEQGCPAWVEYAERNLQTGEDRFTKECVFQALPKFLIHTLAAANQAAATMDSHRNEIVTAFAPLAHALQAARELSPERPAPGGLIDGRTE